MSQKKRSAETQELIDVLIAISVVARRLANKIEEEEKSPSEESSSNV